MSTPTRPRACQYGNGHDTPPTARQREVYDFIATHFVEHLYQPSLREIAAHSGNKPVSNAVRMVLRPLHAKGWIDLSGGQARAVRLLRGPRIVVEDLGEWASGEGRSDPLSRKLMDTLAFFISFSIEHLYQPSLKEISAHFGLSAPPAAKVRMGLLRDKGWIDFGSRDKRAIRILRKPAITVDYSHLGESGVAR